MSHQDLWQAFLPQDEDRYRIFVHSKDPSTARVTLPNAVVVEDPIETEWATISIVEATHKLFGMARDAGCDVFVRAAAPTSPAPDRPAAAE